METLSINEFEGSLVLIHKTANVIYIHFMTGFYAGLTEVFYNFSMENRA